MRKSHLAAVVLASIMGLNFSGCSKDTENTVVAAATALGLISDSYHTMGNMDLVIPANIGVLANDSNVDKVESFDTISANNGSVSMNLDGSFIYTPVLGFSGTDTFEYRIGADEATVTIEVENVVWFVKNNAAAGGDGTQDHPFQFLVDAQSASSTNDFIYIDEGDGTSFRQASGIVLKDSQTLIGEGVALMTSTGFELIPAGNQPIITHTAGDAVILADGNTIKGLVIDSATAKGIEGSAIDGVQILDSEIINNGDRAIEIVNSEGALIFQNLTIDGNGGDGIHFTTSGSKVATLTISDNTITDGSFDGICLAASDTSKMNATLSMNQVSLYSDNGIEVHFSDDATGKVAISNQNTVSSNTGEGIFYESNNDSNSELVVDQNNTIENNSSDGIEIEVNNASKLLATIANNMINSNSAQGIDLESHSTSTFELTLTSNTFDDNGSNGIRLVSNNSSKFRTIASGNILTNNAIYGADLISNSSSQFCIDFKSNNSDSGFRFDQNSTSAFFVVPLDGSNVGTFSTSGTFTPIVSCPQEL